MDTKRSILCAVRDQIRAKSSVDKSHAAIIAEWTPQQWWEAFQFLFVTFRSLYQQSSNAHEDDLLFFVRTPAALDAAPAVDNIGQLKQPFFVRRKAKKLPPDLQLSGGEFSNIDWCQTVLLNLVLQSKYQLTVHACRQELLKFVAEGRTWGTAIRSVTKPVFASPTRTAVNLDSTRAQDSAPQVAYPDICFSVDNFDDAFENLVLTEPSQCYSVVLEVVMDEHTFGSSSGAPQPELYEPFAPVHAIPDAITVHTGTPDPSEAGSRPAEVPETGAVSISISRKASAALPSTARLAGERSGPDLQDVSLSQENSVDMGQTLPPPPPLQLQQQPQQPAQQPPSERFLPAINARAQQGASASAASSDGGATAGNHSAAGSASHASDGSSTPSTPWRIGTAKRTLFGAYVSYEQLLEFMRSKQPGLVDAFFASNFGASKPRREKVVMSGPDSIGRCEVAVTKTYSTDADASGRDPAGRGGDDAPSTAAPRSSPAADSTASPPASTSKPGRTVGPSSFLQLGVTRARELAKQASKKVAEMSNTINSAQSLSDLLGTPHMECALMLLKLPVAYIAEEVLATV